MFDRQYAVLMAEYNAYMKDKLFEMSAALPDQERRRERGAFFRSIKGTLDPLLWGDRAFLIRRLHWDLPIGTPGDVLFEGFDALRTERRRFDGIMLDWARTLEDGALAKPIQFYSVVYWRKRRIPLY